MEEELYKRYNLLKDNIRTYLLQFMYEDSDKEFEIKDETRAILGYNRRKYKDIYLKIGDYQLNRIINFMFNLKTNYEFFKSTDYKKIQDGYNLIDKKKLQKNDPEYEEKLDLCVLFYFIKDYLKRNNYDNTKDIYTLSDYDNLYNMELYNNQKNGKQKLLKKN